MALSFFRALDPTSENSGITYCLAAGSRCQGKEMLDYTVGESIANVFNRDLDFISGLHATYHMLVGTHYDIHLNGRNDNKGGAKGALDYLILPLVARKLLADSYLPERVGRDLLNALAWTVAIPLELARFTAAFALTLLLVPVVAIVHLIKACLPKQEQPDETSTLLASGATA